MVGVATVAFFLTFNTIVPEGISTITAVLNLVRVGSYFKVQVQLYGCIRILLASIILLESTCTCIYRYLYRGTAVLLIAE